MTPARSFLSLLLLLFLYGVRAQEFKIHSNGLIYSDTTMRQLSRIVDSLDLRFRTCELNRSFHSLWQTKGHYLRLDTLAEAGYRDLQTGMDLNAWRQRYPWAEIDTHLLVVAFWLDDEKSYEFRSWPGQDWVSVRLDSLGFNHPVRGQHWYHLRYYPLDTSAYLRIFVFTADWQSRPLPEAYARWVQYADCMVDTTTTTYFVGAYEEGEDADSVSLPARDRLWAYVDPPGKPQPGTDEYWKKYDAWCKKRDARVQDTLSKTPQFAELLTAAADEAVRRKVSAEELEPWVGQYLPKKKLLNLLRLRQVWGMCSQDDSPRIHARNIAKTAAESASWEVFLRSHLDLLSDRFPRASDGSYAWGRRETYLPELEALGLNVSDLMFGITLRIRDAAKNHYYGNVGRLGRGLSEAKNTAEIESKVLAGIADPALDDFNRLLLFYLYDHLAYWKVQREMGEDADQEEVVKRADAMSEQARQKLPAYLATRKD